MTGSSLAGPANQDRHGGEGPAFAAEVQRLTNTAALEEWPALYHRDAVAEWSVDGVCERHVGIDAIRPAAAAMTELSRARRFRVRKQVQCADSDCVVLTFDGTFEGRGTVIGSEIWTFREGLVTGHRMHAFRDVRARTSGRARSRVLLTSPRIAVTAIPLERRYARCGDWPRTVAADRVAGVPTCGR